ncbi:MAG: hemolysin D [Betaproteobacteria bacterium]|nr:MAG: hemolysin D [Betaproteobacteria bacterium]
MHRTTIVVATAAAIALTGALAAGLLAAQDKRTPHAPARQAAAEAALVAPVELRTVEDYYAADAVVEAVRQATVSAQIAGTITQFYVDAGDRVKRGQVLARIDARETDAQVAAGRAGVAQAEAAAVQARLNYERTRSLVAQNFVSQASLDKADADYKAALAALEAARAGSAQAVTARSFAEVRAPIDGVVSQRLMEVGELATPGKPVLALHDPSALRAVGSLPQFVLPQTAKVQKASVKLPAANRIVAATRVTVLPAADARLLSTLIRADLPTDLPAGVVPGTAAKIRVPLGSAQKLVMPADALIRRGELTAAYVVGADGAPQLRQVRVGPAYEGGVVEVLAGLAEGERVQLNPLVAKQ